MQKNLQYRRTDRDIINAFVTLAAQKPFEELTVQDIMEEALVSRYTFYKHFKDKYEIAERLQDEMMADFVEMRSQMQKKMSGGVLSQKQQNEAWCRFSRKHHAVSEALSGIHTETVDLNKRYKEVFRRDYLEHAEGANLELEADIYASAQLALMEYFAAEPNMNSDNLGKPLQRVLVNVCLYLAHLEPVEEVKRALAPFLEE